MSTRHRSHLVNTRRLNIAIAFTAFLAAGSASQTAAQEKLAVDARGGIAVPASDLAELEDVGASFGVGLSYRLTPRIALRLDGDADILSGTDDEVSGSSAPDMNIYHYGAGLGLAILDPSRSRWALDVNVGAGGSTFDVDTFSAGGSTVDFSETYVTTYGGLTIGYDVSPNVSVFTRGQAYLALTDEEDTAVFSQISSEIDAGGFDTAWTIPITAGISFRF